MKILLFFLCMNFNNEQLGLFCDSTDYFANGFIISKYSENGVFLEVKDSIYIYSSKLQNKFLLKIYRKFRSSSSYFFIVVNEKGIPININTIEEFNNYDFNFLLVKNDTINFQIFDKAILFLLLTKGNTRNIYISNNQNKLSAFNIINYPVSVYQENSRNPFLLKTNDAKPSTILYLENNKKEYLLYIHDYIDNKLYIKSIKKKPINKNWIML